MNQRALETIHDSPETAAEGVWRGVRGGGAAGDSSAAGGGRQHREGGQQGSLDPGELKIFLRYSAKAWWDMDLFHF